MLSAFAITAIIAFFVAHTAHATPLTETNNALAAVAAALPLSPTTLSTPAAANARGTNFTSAHDFPALDGLLARQEFPATLLLCAAANCESCGVGTDLSEFPADVCHPAFPSFVSTGIVQPSGQGLPFAVLVGPPGCEEFAQIPEVNVCFNIQGEAFNQWELFD